MLKSKKDLICVILSGGKGARLDGEGKYNQKLNDMSLLEHVYHKVKNQFIITAVNLNNKERKVSLKIDLVYDQFLYNVGPLAGIHSALNYGQEKIGEKGYVCTVPVDTPFLPKDLAQKFYENIKNLKVDVVMAKSRNRIHPTIAIWKNNLLPRLQESIEKGVRKIDQFTSELKVSVLEWDIVKIDPFYNINNYEDLEEAKKWL